MDYENKITAYDGGKFSLGDIRLEVEPRLWDVAGRTETNLVSLNRAELALTLKDARKLLDVLTSAIEVAEVGLDFIVHDSGTITMDDEFAGQFEFETIAEFREQFPKTETE
jgi:hypothetical protein